MDGLDTLKAKYLTAVAAAADESALEEVRLAALGKKGEISAMMATLGKMDPDARKAAGASLNALKDDIDAALRARKSGRADFRLHAPLILHRGDSHIDGDQYAPQVRDALRAGAALSF